MARERIRQEVPASFGAEEIGRHAQQGWKLVAVEWERELPLSEETQPREDVPFGLRIAEGPPARLEENPTEQEVLLLMMELTIQDGPYSAIAQELNRRGYRTRQGAVWTAISVFQMLPRLIETGPKILSGTEWQRRRAHLAAGR